MGKFLGITHIQILWFWLFSVFVLGATYYLILGRGAQSQVTEQLLERKRIIARAQASNIISYFKTFGNSVAVLAQLSSIDRRDASTLSDMDIFVEQRRASGLTQGVILTDKNGVVRFNSNVLGTRDVGKSVADRDYFIWARTKAEEGEYYISEPVISREGTSKDQTIIVVASPVYQNGKFSGVIASSIKFGPLVERFFGLMKVSNLTDVYLIDGRGNLLYGNSSPNAIGSKALSDITRNALEASSEGKFKTQDNLIAYTTIPLGTQNWLLIISTPAQEVEELARPFYVRQTAVLILTSFTILLFGAIAIRKTRA